MQIHLLTAGQIDLMNKEIEITRDDHEEELVQLSNEINRTGLNLADILKPLINLSCN